MERKTVAPEVTGAEDEPNQLWLVAPFRAVQGEYVLQKGRDNWNQPLWRQLKGASWLFSSPDGFWRFANNDLELAEHLGHIQSSEPHAGKLPHQVLQWQHHDGSAWYNDRGIKVTTSPNDFEAFCRSEDAEEHSSLWLVAPRFPQLQGEYRKQETRKERGQPVWRQVSGEGWIFSTNKGRWFISDTEEGIANNRGVLASTTQHNGSAPYQIDQWQFLSQGSWQSDQTIFLTEKQAEAQRRVAEQQREAVKRTDRAPDKVWILCQPKPHLQGEYVKQPARIERGQAVWRQLGGNGILYSNGLGGFWCVATKEADVQKNLGLLQCSTPHYGRPPHEMESWQFADGNTWRVHKNVRVTASRQEGLAALAEQDADAQRRAKLAPSQLWLKAPSRMALEGEYTKVPERMERGQVVWKQHCGPGWIYSTSGGRWFITDREDGISACTGVLASVSPHQNRFPQETEQWQEFTSGVWQIAPSVAVVVDEECLKLRHLSSLSMDNEFQVLAPKFPQNLWVMSSELTELEGEYISCGSGMWKQDGGTMQLAAVLQQGMERWCFREEGSSNCRVRGATNCEVSPHLTQQWQMLEGSTWRDTSRFCVLANPETREPHVYPTALESCLIEEEVSPLPSPQDRDKAKVPTDRRVEALGAHFSPDMLEGVAQVPDNLRERVISEVHCLLAQAQFAMSPQQAELDLDLLVEECCHALMIEQVAHGHIDAQQISREVLRTVLRGWGKPRNSPQNISPSPLTVRQHLPQFLENEVRTHAHSRADLLMDDGPAGCESQVLGCQVLPCRSPQGTISPCPIS
mmetsp:Transcript_50616/g.103086  ORF Transcript_50616/g.103086 Transcript_50616/m.103086 type:complete len:801 (+) Transcript_50616:39-2441(+)